MIDTMAHKVLGGNVYNAISYFTALHYAYATIVIHLAAIVGGVIPNESPEVNR